MKGEGVQVREKKKSDHKAATMLRRGPASR